MDGLAPRVALIEYCKHADTTRLMIGFGDVLEEMVDKFLGQSANKEALLEEKAQAEKDLKDVVKAKQGAQKKFADMKAQVAQSGIGGAELNRDIYDKLDEEILGAKAELKMNRSAADRLERVLVSVQQPMSREFLFVFQTS